MPRTRRSFPDDVKAHGRSFVGWLGEAELASVPVVDASEAAAEAAAAAGAAAGGVTHSLTNPTTVMPASE
jgi:hypothetical protein